MNCEFFLPWVESLRVTLRASPLFRISCWACKAALWATTKSSAICLVDCSCSATPAELSVNLTQINSESVYLHLLPIHRCVRTLPACMLPVLPVHGVLSPVLPGLRLQEVTDGVSVGKELSVGVKGHSIHSSCTPADL